MSVTFLIKYARATTDTGVSDVFKATLECEVMKVTSLDKIDTHNGNRTFKMFFIVVKKNERVEQFAEQIKQHGFMTIVYNHPYFWKIHLAENKPSTRPPRIMTIEEQERIVGRARAPAPVLPVPAPVPELEPGEIVESEAKPVEPISGIYDEVLSAEESDGFMQEALKMATKRFGVEISSIDTDFVPPPPPGAPTRQESVSAPCWLPGPADLEQSETVSKTDTELMPPPPPRARKPKSKVVSVPALPEVVHY